MTRYLSAGFILSLLIVWSIIDSDSNPAVAFDKYTQAVTRVVDNYVDEPNLQVLLSGGIKGLVKGLNDSTLTVQNTPLDTVDFADVQTLKEHKDAFLLAWEYALDEKPNADPAKLAEDAIRGMLYSLDPHSVYINPTTSARVLEDFEGRFSGIGLSYELVNDTVTVVYVLNNGPAYKNGLFPGDKLLAIDTTRIVGASTDLIRGLMRGPENSVVSITRLQYGAKQPDKVVLKRETVPLRSIDASFMLDDVTGYVRMNRFAATTHTEFVNAVEVLQKMGMKQLLLDLRNNGGGYLQQALLLVDEFVDGRRPVLNTTGRHKQFSASYRSSRDGRLHDVPLMILVNQGSASASEVVSGALQDYDRALIVGRRTFGKGLVQQQYLLNDRSIVRVTTSRYYTPSGRLIQKPYINGREAYVGEISTRDSDASTDIKNYVEHIPDSLKYKTQSGRIVYGGGGIVPDHILMDTLQSPILDHIRRGRHHYPFLFNLLSRYGKKRVLNDVIPNPNTYAENGLFTAADKATFRNVLADMKIYTGLTGENDSQRRGDSLIVKQSLLDHDLPMIYEYMNAELSRFIWGSAGYWQIASQSYDKSIVESQKLWGEYSLLTAN